MTLKLSGSSFEPLTSSMEIFVLPASVDGKRPNRHTASNEQLEHHLPYARPSRKRAKHKQTRTVSRGQHPHCAHLVEEAIPVEEEAGAARVERQLEKAKLG
jgi:hypothetical protein